MTQYLLRPSQSGMESFIPISSRGSSVLIGTVVLLLAVCAAPLRLAAIPQFSLLSGNRCQNCHVNMQGSGLRNELGWYSNNDVGLIKPESIGLDGVYESIGKSNTVLSDNLTVGMDFRLQMAKSHKSPDAERKIFPMQAALHAAYTATDWLTFEGMYSFGKKRYNGQALFSASTLVQPDLTWPQVRIGFFQPSIGIRYDDHTMLVRQIAGTDYVPLIAPNYADAGAELAYEGIKWLTVNAGVFRADNLSENTVQDSTGQIYSLVSASDLTVNGRVVFWPRLFDHTLNTYAGTSLLANGDFILVNVFAGLGWTDHISLMAEYAHSDKPGMRKTDNVSAEALYKVSEPILLYVRGERGRTLQYVADGGIRNYMTQWVIGAQLFVLPYVEVRPEFRVVDTEQVCRTSDQYKSGRFTLQLHMFY